MSPSLLLCGLLSFVKGCLCLSECNAVTALEGSWNILEAKIPIGHAYATCPRTRRYISDHPSLNPHIQKYSCHNASYHPAEYTTNCHIMRIEEASVLLTDRKEYISLVGDSLMAQLYISILCVLEKYNFPSDRIQLHSDLFLRPDIPCKDDCLTNKTFLQRSGEGILYNPCFACKNGVKKPFDDSYFIDHMGWPSQILPGTTSLVIGSGAWYSTPDQYFDMLNRTKWILSQLVVKGIKVYWLDLPPMGMFAASDPEKYNYFGWIKFRIYNERARDILSPVGVVFLDTSKATEQRKVADPAVASDHMHWCNPGSHSVPSFIARLLLHLISSGSS